MLQPDIVGTFSHFRQKADEWRSLAVLSRVIATEKLLVWRVFQVLNP